MPVILDCFRGEFDPILVGIALAICGLGSYSSIVAAERVHAASDRQVWPALFAVCATSTVWATHFVAMLAYRIDLPTTYALGPTALSYLVGLVVSGGALLLAPRYSVRGESLVYGLAFGLGVAALHYVGMSAVRIPGHLEFEPWLVGLSVALSCSLGMATVVRLYTIDSRHDWNVAVLLFALTVLTLHFVGMSAVTFVLDGSLHAPVPSLSRNGLAAAASAAAASVVVITLFGASVDKRLSRRLAFESARFRALADAALEGLIIHRDGRVIDTNVAARRLLLLEPAAPIDLVDLFPGGALPAADERPVETEMLRGDGRRVPVEIHRGPIRAADDSAAELLALRDLTARREAEGRLAAALDDVGRLRDLIPMCAWCKKVRNDAGYWRSVDDYIARMTGSDITHGVCPECFERIMQGMDGRPAAR